MVVTLKEGLATTSHEPEGIIHVKEGFLGRQQTGKKGK